MRQKRRDFCVQVSGSALSWFTTQCACAGARRSTLPARPRSASESAVFSMRAARSGAEWTRLKEAPRGRSAIRSPRITAPCAEGDGSALSSLRGAAAAAPSSQCGASRCVGRDIFKKNACHSPWWRTFRLGVNASGFVRTCSVLVG